jgi:predicted alpha/beta-fold hydrolase
MSERFLPRGFHSFHPEDGAKWLAILVHGWEGSAESTYIKALGKTIFQQGYDMFRLNLCGTMVPVTI